MKRIILLVVVVILATLRFYPPARLGAWVVLGRAQNCPMANALNAPEELREQIANKDRILYASKMVEGEERYKLYTTPDGPYWLPVGSEYVLPFNLAEQARDIYGRNNRGVKAGDIVLDCGANIGVYTRHALRKGAKLVVAIEPAPENIECLRRNFKEEIAAGKVIIYPKGVWHKDDMLELHVDPHNSAADSFMIDKQGWGKVEKVPLTTIDKLVDELKLERVDYVKMDIEGAETNALEGGRATIAKYKPRMALSAYHNPDHPKRIPEIVKQTNPSYQMECGPCAEISFGLRPDILYFFE